MIIDASLIKELLPNNHSQLFAQYLPFAQILLSTLHMLASSELKKNHLKETSLALV